MKYLHEFKTGIRKQLHLEVPEFVPEGMEAMDEEISGHVPVEEEIPADVEDPGEHRNPEAVKAAALISYDVRRPLTRRHIIFSTIKRGAKTFLAAGATAYLTTKDPVSALVWGGAMAIIGGGSKYVAEDQKARGNHGAAAAANPVDTFFKIILELLRVVRLAYEDKRSQGGR